MSSSLVTSKGVRFLFPIVLLAFVSQGMDSIIQLTKNNWGVAENLPYVLLSSALLMCYSFRQGRACKVCIAMLLSYFIIQYRLQVPLSSGTTLLELTLLTTLLPVSLFAVFLFDEDGFDSKAILIYILLLAMFVFWSYITLSYYVEGGFEDWTNGILFIVPSISKLPLVLVLYCVGIILFLAILLLRKNEIIHAILYSAIVLASATFIFFDVQYISSTMYTLMGLLIIVYSTSASYQLAFTDSLTQVPSRRALDLDLKHLGRKYTIAMLDIDHFKKFNDTYGHDVGDDVLKMVASRLSKTSGGAIAYRFGGEEFTLVFKGKYAEQCKTYIEDARMQIEQYGVVVRNEMLRPDDHEQGIQKRGKGDAEHKTVFVTASFGVADSRVERDPEEVIKLADDALYKAKKAGRNCIKFS
ncbi:GGDEF domain-containing protein [Vibrio sp. CAU 1672]|uniref:GGDEF domain-containing protein n=1 Tax=Vibrio sp. CAU 1672 TaxID=3032594 RepID=UPI0023DBB597|nr:GGDEF domain-containing protein [Vibrio sp. CAU 1672]MDF2154488.1 GGDEF domain-containing protein [Vibrio sp. CAU 1672]